MHIHIRKNKKGEIEKWNMQKMKFFKLGTIQN